MAEPALCLALLPFLVQEGASCLWKETIRAHPSPNFCVCLRLLPSLLHLASPAPHPHRTCHPPAQGSPNSSSVSRTCTMGKSQAIHRQRLIPGTISPTEMCQIHRESCQNSEQAIWEVPGPLQFSDSPGELLQKSPYQSSHLSDTPTLVPNHRSSRF